MSIESKTETIQITGYMLQGDPGRFTDLVKIDADPKSQPSQELTSGGSGGTQIDGVRCASRVLDGQKWHEFVLHSHVHKSCCEVKAEDTVGLGYDLTPLQGNATNLSSAMESDIRLVMARSVEALVTAAKDAEKTGYCGLEIVPTLNGRELYRLNHIDSWTLWPSLDLQWYMHKRGEGQARRFTPLGVRDPKFHQLAWLNNEQWFKNTYYGVPDITSVLIQIDAVWEALNYNRDFFKRRGGYRWMLLLSSPQDRGNAGTDASLITHINYATRNIGKDSETDMLMIPLGDRTARLERLDADAKDLDFAGMMKSFNGDILAAHRVPPEKIGMGEAGSLGGNLGQEQIQVYADSVIRPKQRRWNALMTQILYHWYGVWIDFKFQPIRINEVALMASPAKLAFESMLVSRTEARAMIGLPPAEIDAGREVFADELGINDRPQITIGPGNGNPQA